MATDGIDNSGRAAAALTTQRKRNDMSATTAARFPLGQIVATPGAIEALARAEQTAIEFLSRHQHGDWGDLCEEDRRENEFSVDKELRIFSAYHTKLGDKLWVITEADRSATTILLPSEY
jgi:hypothetical protein